MYLQLLQSETTTKPKLDIVLYGRTPHRRPQQAIDWPRSNSGRFALAVHTTRLFRARLVEPGAHVQLPVLAEVRVGQDVVVRNHFLSKFFPVVPPSREKMVKKLRSATLKSSTMKYLLYSDNHVK